MKAIRFNPYSNGSKGLKLLKQELRGRGHHDVKEILKVNSRYHYKPAQHVVINWGVPGNNNPEYLNYKASIAANKLSTFKALEDINPLEFSTLKNHALRWLDEGYTVYARTELCSSQGRGIVLIQPGSTEVIDAPLYTRGISGTLTEFRIHVFNGQVIDAVQKRRLSRERREAEGIEVNDLIRNHSNGYIFAREGIIGPDDTKTLALESIEALGLNFGAVDVVWNEGSSYVLEVNTAPGITNSTVTAYANAIELLV